MPESQQPTDQTTRNGALVLRHGSPAFEPYQPPDVERQYVVDITDLGTPYLYWFEPYMSGLFSLVEVAAYYLSIIDAASVAGADADVTCESAPANWDDGRWDFLAGPNPVAQSKLTGADLIRRRNTAPDICFGKYDRRKKAFRRPRLALPGPTDAKSDRP